MTTQRWIVACRVCRPWLRGLLVCLIVIHVINFVSFVRIADNLGGNPAPRKAGDSRYFVVRKGGYKTEVSREDWESIKAHGATIPLTFLSFWVVGLLMGFTEIAIRRADAESEDAGDA